MLCNRNAASSAPRASPTSPHATSKPSSVPAILRLPLCFHRTDTISQPSFYAWRRQIALRDQPATSTPQATTPTFVKLALEAAASSAVEIVLPDGRLLRVRSGCDTELLRQVLRLLEEPSC